MKATLEVEVENRYDKGDIVVFVKPSYCFGAIIDIKIKVDGNYIYPSYDIKTADGLLFSDIKENNIIMILNRREIDMLDSIYNDKNKSININIDNGCGFGEEDPLIKVVPCNG